jgi:hypothetical protein
MPWGDNFSPRMPCQWYVSWEGVGRASGGFWLVSPFPPPKLEWHSDVLSCHLWIVTTDIVQARFLLCICSYKMLYNTILQNRTATMTPHGCLQGSLHLSHPLHQLPGRETRSQMSSSLEYSNPPPYFVHDIEWNIFLLTYLYNMCAQSFP